MSVPAFLKQNESKTSSFLASISEDAEEVRPEYDYTLMQEKQISLETKIRKLKHALNVFNTTRIIPEYGFTIDEILVYLPQLTKRCSKLSIMKDALPKVREDTAYMHGVSIIDYRYANYDINQVNTDYQKFSDELAKAQMAFDLVNNTVEFEIDM